MSSIEEQIENLLTHQKYREAVRKLDAQAEQQPGYKSDAEYKTLLGRIKREARNHLEALDQELSGLLSKEPDAFTDEDEDRAKVILEEQEKANLDNTSTSISTSRSRLNDKLIDRDRLRIYRDVKKHVDAIWQEARRRAREVADISTDALLVHYDQAVEIVQNVLSQSPDNVYLKSLLSAAQEERERVAKERDAMTSGVQKEQFLAVLCYVEQASDDDYIQIFDLNGKPMGRMKKVDALEETKRQAILAANQHVPKYCEAAQEALRRHDPRRAKAELDRVAKFDELTKFIPEAELYEPKTFSLLSSTRNETKA
ncbi:MAG: hypothetical protein NZ750_12175, partial [Anaerolineae bacterium]|nr:hypothetical protein [Anaerolineae bacterium]MDW8173880.1 hypothetical protein [Anaerolineae bacterium]